MGARVCARTHTRTHTDGDHHRVLLFSREKGQPFGTTFTDLGGTLLSEISQMQKDQDCVHHLHAASNTLTHEVEKGSCRGAPGGVGGWGQVFKEQKLLWTKCTAR